MTEKTISIEKFKLATKNLSEQIKTRVIEFAQSIAKNKENNGVTRLKRIVQRALEFLRLAMAFTISIFLIIAVALIIVAPALILALTCAVVSLTIFVFSAPFICFFASKRNGNSTEHQKNSDTLQNETVLHCTLREEQTDRNKKTINKENFTDNNPTRIRKNSSLFLFFDEENSNYQMDTNQHANSFVSKSF